MTKVVITLPEFFPGEAEKIAAMLNSGIADLIHLRKPGSSAADMERLIQQIPSSLHRCLVLHDHHHLAPQYGLYGIHLNSRNPEPAAYSPSMIQREINSPSMIQREINSPSMIQREINSPSKTRGGQGALNKPMFNSQFKIQNSKFSTSRSCHSLEEVTEWKERCNYVSLSPIFDSISKQGYRSAFSREELQQARRDGIIDDKVFALGGITFDRLPEVETLGFGGAMILGDAWKSPTPVRWTPPPLGEGRSNKRPPEGKLIN